MGGPRSEDSLFLFQHRRSNLCSERVPVHVGRRIRNGEPCESREVKKVDFNSTKIKSANIKEEVIIKKKKEL